MDRLGVGWALHPDVEYLELTRGIIEREADYYEINPETLWRPRDGALGARRAAARVRRLH